MSTGRPGGLDSGEVQWNNVAIQQSDNPSDGPNKSLRLACPPVHILGPVDSCNLFRQSLRQNVRSASAFLSNRRSQILAFGAGDLFQLGDGNARFLGESFGGWSRFAIL